MDLAGFVSTFVSGTVLGSLHLLIRYASRVYTRFRLPASEVVTGRFTVDAGDGSGRPPTEEENERLRQLISKEQMQLAQASDD